MASGSFSTTFHDEGYKLIVDWVSTPTTSTNSSVVKATIKMYCPYALNIKARTGNTIKIGGVSYTFSGVAVNVSKATTVTLATVTSNAIAHNADGSKSVAISCSYKVNATISGEYVGTSTASKTVTLDKIARAATIVSAENFNDEGNPSITYSNPAGNAVEGLAVCISFTGDNPDIAYRDVSKTGTSYTFNLTDAERNVLRNGTTTANSRTVYFYIRTTIDGTNYYSKVAKTLTIVNATPTLNPTVTDVGTASTALTGDGNKIIKWYNYVSVNSGAAVYKGATIAKQTITCGGKVLNAGSGSMSNVESATFVFSVTDSRGNTVSKTVTKTLIDYVHLTCNLKPEKPDVSGNLTYTLSGNYFNGSFGKTNNSLVLQYRIKEENGEFGAWQTVTPTFSGNTYSYSGTITGLDYRTAYRMEAQAVDKIETAESLSYYLKSMPVFDWSENDFNFNVPVTITDGYLSYPLLGLCRAMTKAYNCTVSVTPGANYSSASGSATICGNVLRCNIVATRTTAYSGDNANERVASVYIDHGGKIAGMLNVGLSNGATGGVASLYTTEVSQTETTLNFSVYLAATAEPMTGINSFFQVPITLNLDAFV